MLAGAGALEALAAIPLGEEGGSHAGTSTRRLRLAHALSLMEGTVEDLQVSRCEEDPVNDQRGNEPLVETST